MKLLSLRFLCLASLVGCNGIAARRSPFLVQKSATIAAQSNQAVLHTQDTATVVPTGIPRGGDCSETNPTLLFKIAVGVLSQSAALLGILLASLSFSDLVPSKVYNQPLLELLASMVVVFGSSFVGAFVDGSLSAATNQALNPTKVLGSPDWYANLQKPNWTPPGWVFPIMWLIVSKPTQLCATSRIFKYSTGGVDVKALALYTTTLALGDTWNKVFFGLECIGLGTLVITIYFAALLATAYSFYQIDALAGYYMLPTCGWVAVATMLQYSIDFLNKNKQK